jgi:hypothetical protein
MELNLLKFGHLVGFITKKFDTMHGHMNVKSLHLLPDWFTALTTAHITAYIYKKQSIPSAQLQAVLRLSLATCFDYEHSCPALSLQFIQKVRDENCRGIQHFGTQSCTQKLYNNSKEKLQHKYINNKAQNNANIWPYDHVHESCTLKLKNKLFTSFN